MGHHWSLMFGGPGHLRFYLQPAIALLLGLRDGHKDARAGRGSYLLAILRSAGRRRDRMREGLEAILIPLAIAFVLDLVFQAIIRERLRLWAAVMYVVVFVTVPYVVARAIGNRVVSASSRHRWSARP